MKRVIENILSRIRNIVSLARVTNIIKDNKPFPLTQVQYMQKTKDSIVALPYGLTSSPILDSIVVKIAVGNDENVISIPLAGDERPKGLLEGEVALYNGKTDTKIFLNQDGSIVIDSKNKITIDALGNIEITAPEVLSTTNITNTGTLENTGNVTINGTLQVNGDITSTGAVEGATVTDGIIDLALHTHAVTTAPGTTGPAL